LIESTTKSTKKCWKSHHHPWLGFSFVAFVIFVVQISEFQIQNQKSKIKNCPAARVFPGSRAHAPRSTSNIRLAAGGKTPDAPAR